MSDYGTPPPPPPAPGYNAPVGGGTPPPNHLVWSILTTLFCCLPLGIVSIIFAAQVNGKWQAGDYAGALDSSQKAKRFAIWAAVGGVIVTIIYFALAAAGVISTSKTNGM